METCTLLDITSKATRFLEDARKSNETLNATTLVFLTTILCSAKKLICLIKNILKSFFLSDRDLFSEVINRSDEEPKKSDMLYENSIWNAIPINLGYRMVQLNSSPRRKLHHFSRIR